MAASKGAECDGLAPLAQGHCIGLHAVLAHGHQCPRSDLHRHCARFKSAVSALDYVGVTNVEFRMKNAE